MLNKFLICYELANSERNGKTLLQVLAGLGDTVQFYPGCLVLLSKLNYQEIGERLGEALRDGDRLGVFAIEDGSLYGLSESQEERMKVLDEKSYESYRARSNRLLG